MSDDRLEVEVKFYVPELGDFRQRLLGAGASLRHPRTYERNVRFDNAWEGLRRRGELLRLRQDAAARLTFKGVPLESGSVEVKVREELEVEVSDFATLAAILERLGFSARQLYEKYRESFSFAGVEVLLDEMPFGNFIELEGDAEAIRAAADRLGLDWSRRIVDNYLALMGRLIAHHALPFEDITFANFATVSVSVADILAP
jgi:adenylate cyclase class 2